VELDLLELARAQLARQRALANQVVAWLLASWATLGRRDPGGDWMALLLRAAAALAHGQLLAAQGGAEYAARAADQQGAAADAAVVIGLLAGVASDGRPLEALLWQPIQTVKDRTAAGMAVQDALTVGEEHLARIVQVQVADAGRVATGLDIVTRPRMGYVRITNPPTCARCAILAGRHYRWSAGFARHPRCDCVHVPATEDRAGDVRTDPRALFDAGHVHGLSRADTQAIAAGADMGKVVNAHRGMYVAGERKLTTEGIKARRGGVRLMPEQIYREAAGDRDEALRLLRRFGYIA
jgi:hypothetical protein